MPINRAQWSSPVADVESRLRKLDTVLHQAQRADGSVDLKKAKAMVGVDLRSADLLGVIRRDFTSTELSPAHARRAFMDLQTAISSAADLDTNRDGALGFEELSWHPDNDPATQLIARAALPVELSLHETPKPRVALSLDARREAEAVINATAQHHAATPAGAEAIKWEMRDRLSQGIDITSGMMFDAVNYSETNWKASIPFFGRKHREGQGHLSDKELQVRYGPDLGAYVEKTRAAINTRLMMDYERDFLAGKDLP